MTKIKILKLNKKVYHINFKPNIFKKIIKKPTLISDVFKNNGFNIIRNVKTTNNNYISHIKDSNNRLHILKMSSSNIKTDGRTSSSKIEKERLKYLTKNPNNLIDLFKEKYDISVKSIYLAGGLSNHHDLCIEDINDKVYTIEVKSYCGKKKLDIDAPWTGGVTPQIYNGKGSDFKISNEYANHFYDICLPILKNNYNIINPIPEKNQWLKDDCFHIGNPKTLFGKDLHNKLKMDNRDANLLWYDNHKEYIQNYVSQKEKNKLLATEIESCFKTNLTNKDYWLNIQYKSKDDLVPMWEEDTYLLSKIPNILDFCVKDQPLIRNKSAVICYEYTTSSDPNKKHCGEARMRWRNRIGGNLGWNIS